MNPVNANITPGMIKLVDSKSETLDSLIEITKVEKYDEYLYKETEGIGTGTQSRASIATGLWKVTLQPKANIDVEKEIAQTTKVGDVDKSILFAVAINNTASQEEEVQGAADRYVVSDYELTVGKADNGFEAAKYPTATGSKTGITVKNTDLSDCKDYNEGKSDNFIQAKNGEEIEISFGGDAVKDKIDRFYVVLDKRFGQDKEWSAYTYDGLNEVVAVNKGLGKGYVKVTIPETSTITDLSVPFRIFAVNRNGEYYNKQGNAFTLHIIKSNKQASVSADMNFTGYEKMESGWSPIDASLQDASEASTTAIVNMKTVVVTDALGHKVTLNVEYATDDKGSKAEKDSDVKYVKFSVEDSSVGQWINGGEAKGTISNKINSLQVSLTKIMPTKENVNINSLKTYTWKEGQLVDGVYTAYMNPNYLPWSSIPTTSDQPYSYWGRNAESGFLRMSEDGPLKDFPYDNRSYSVKIDGVPIYMTSILGCSSSQVDAKTQHESAITYNYGNISSDKENDGYSDSDGNYRLVLETFKTVLACPLDESVQTYTWEKLKTSATTYDDVNYLVYGDGTQHIQSAESRPGYREIWSVLNYIKGTNKFKNSDFGKTLNALLKGDYQKYINDAGTFSVKLITNATGQEDYFSVQLNIVYSEKQTYVRFKPKTDKGNPGQDVPSTLVFTLLDAYGHTNTIKMPFTVKRRN